MKPANDGDTAPVVLPQALYQQIVAEARAAPELEICGLIAARDGQPVRCTAIRNIAREPRQRFRMDPRAQIDAFRLMREQGEELFGIYHSHPAAPAAPSATDILEAGYPDVLHLIVSLLDRAAPELRAFRFPDGSPIPVPLEIRPAAG